MATYQTQQKKELVAFLEKHRDESFTIEELAVAMARDEDVLSPPGQSTIYRIMPRLLEANIVKRFNTGTGRKAAYQIVGGEHCHSHMHMKCLSCGKLLHMSDHESEAMMQIFRQNNRFTLDLTQTMLFGTCSDCTQSDSKGEL